MAFPRFLIAGAVNTGATYALYLGLLYLMPYGWAYTLTYMAGIGFGYFINARWVFKKAANSRSVVLYPLAYGANYMLGIMLLRLFVEQAKMPQEIAPLSVVLISVPLMYLITKLVFKERRPHEETNNQ